MKRSISLGPILCCMTVVAAYGQTKIDLREQTRNIDFSTATLTRPMKTGTALPAACSVGEMYFLTTAASGQNIFGCPAVNTWVQMQGGGSGLPDVTGHSGKVLAVSGASAQWLAPGGDADGAVSALTVRKVQGKAISSATPFNGQVLKWNSAANGGLGQWEPAAESGGGGGGGSNTVSAGTGVTVAQVGSDFAVSIDTAVVPAALFATAPLDFPSINTGTCATALTMSMPGAVADSTLSAGWPTGLETGLLPFMRVSAAGTISVWVCNLSGATVNPVSATYSAVLVKGF
jgi:hypothetical protein